MASDASLPPSSRPSSAAQVRTEGRATPDSSSAAGTCAHSSSTRSTWRSASVNPETRSASRAAWRDAASASAGRPAATQWWASLAGGGAVRRQPRLFGQRPRETLVQHLALTWEQRAVDGLREQRVPEAERAPGLVGDQHVVLDRLPQRTRQLQLAE